jgi:hypothetical protein
MQEFFPVLALGFLLGIRHAADPDHVVAVSTIVARKGTLSSAYRVGAMWGAGHTLTILIIGTAIAMFKVVIPVRVGLSMELAVALMLIVLGALNVIGVPRKDAERSVTLRPFLVGVVHGLAGSAAIALLVMAAIPNPSWSAAYLAVFGVGTLVGMMTITAGIALPIRFAAARFLAIDRHLRFASGALSLAFGLFLVREIGFGDGLFTANPSWNPR